MDSLIKVLKIILLSIGIVIGITILAAVYFVFTAVKSGDFEGFVKDTVAESVVDTDNLSPIQKELYETGDYDALVEDFQENITPEQIDCAIGAIGEVRARELMVTQDPTPQEMFKLSKCL